MNTRLNGGNSNLSGIIILVVIAIIALTSSQSRPASAPSGGLFSGPTITSSTNRSAPGKVGGAPAAGSAYKNEISVSSGNAAYSYQPYEEYITIENYGRNAVNITGWQLRNGKDERPYYLGGTLQRFSADIAVIPQASKLLSPTGGQSLQDIVLNPGERAVVTTGSVGVRTPYAISSFKENICTGYIEGLPDYAFNPALSQTCPRPSQEPGIENLERECRAFINTLSSCRTPELSNKDQNGEPCSTCINGKILSSRCIAFIKERFSYRGCVANHAYDPNFYGRTWRVFLGRGWEMWADEYETVELYDRTGQLVNFQNY